MTKFKSERTNYFIPVLKGWGIFIGIICLIMLLPPRNSNFDLNNTGLYIAVVFFLIQIVQDLAADRYYEIWIDKDNKLIEFLYRKWFASYKRKVVSFDNAKIVMTKERTGVGKLKKSWTIHVLKKKTKLFNINTYKDGFSHETLENVCKSAENLSIPITRL
jgi:hypothetical protein